MLKEVVVKESFRAAKDVVEIRGAAQLEKSGIAKRVNTVERLNSERLEKGCELRPLNLMERKVLKDLGMSKSNIDICSIDQNGVYHLDCRNRALEGGKHPETGVPFERKTVVIDGVKIEGVFPKFESKVQYQLPETMRKATPGDQFKYLNDQLRRDIQSDPELRTKFTPRQIEMIEQGKNPSGCTWHHSEECGMMELVDTGIHAKTGHTGGDSMWCGREEGAA